MALYSYHGAEAVCSRGGRVAAGAAQGAACSRAAAGAAQRAAQGRGPEHRYGSFAPVLNTTCSLVPVITRCSLVHTLAAIRIAEQRSKVMPHGACGRV